MIVCHCHAVSDRTIRACIRSGARSAGAVARVCMAGRCCGGCAPALKELVEKERAALEIPASGLSSAPLLTNSKLLR